MVLTSIRDTLKALQPPISEQSVAQNLEPIADADTEARSDTLCRKLSAPRPVDSEERLLELIKADPAITASKLGEIMGLSVRQIGILQTSLKTKGRLKRIGPTKGGVWRVL